MHNLGQKIRIFLFTVLILKFSFDNLQNSLSAEVYNVYVCFDLYSRKTQTFLYVICQLKVLKRNYFLKSQRT